MGDSMLTNVPLLIVPFIAYNLVALGGVWRSAARHEGPQAQADLARGASVIWMAVLSLT